MTLGTNTDIKVNLFLDGNKIEKYQEVALLGITTDDKLSFKTHIENICRKAKSQYYYAPLIWMFPGKLLISRVQKNYFWLPQVVHNTYDTQLMMNFFQ